MIEPLRTFADTSHLHLEESERRLDHLWISAKKWMTNFAWLGRREAELVALLDYDLICGALPRTQVNAMKQSIDSSDDDLIAPTGQAYLNLLLKQKIHFSIPPGSLAELDRKQSELELNVGESLGWFESILSEAVRNRDPLAFIKRRLAGRTESATDIIFRSFNTIADSTESLGLIKSLREQAIPWEELVSTEESGNVEKVFKNVTQHLDTKRPSKQTNNRNDAYNVALAFKVASAPVGARAVRYFPILVSRTNAVVNYTELLRGFLDTPKHDEPPHVISDPATFRMGCALLACSENRAVIARDYAIQLGRQAGDLKAYLSRMLDSLSTSEIISGQLEIAALMEYEFRKRWTPLLKYEYRVVHRDSNDLMEVIDYTLRKEAAHLDSHTNRLMLEALRKVRAAVHTAQRIHESGIQSAMTHLRDKRPTLAKVFDLPISDVPLAVSESILPVENAAGEGSYPDEVPREEHLSAEELRVPHHRRMQAVHVIAGSNFKVIADSWQITANAGRQVSFARFYAAQVSSVFDEVVRLFAQHLPQGDDRKLLISAFAPDCYYTGDFDLRETKQTVSEVAALWRQSPNIYYSELRLERICFCLEVGFPSPGTDECEVDVCIVFPASEPIPIEMLVQWLNVGSDNPASIQLLEDLLKPLCEYMKLSNAPH